MEFPFGSFLYFSAENSNSFIYYKHIFHCHLEHATVAALRLLLISRWVTCGWSLLIVFSLVHVSHFLFVCLAVLYHILHGMNDNIIVTVGFGVFFWRKLIFWSLFVLTSNYFGWTKLKTVFLHRRWWLTILFSCCSFIWTA